MRSIRLFRTAAALAPLFLVACHTVHVGTEDGGGDPSADAGTAPDAGRQGEACGAVTCAPGLECCNASCGLCVEPGMGCLAVECATECRTHADCAGGEYCSWPEPECPTACALPEGCPDLPARGTCVPRPEVCPDVEAPVCGCDGETWGNACVAAAAGVNVVHDGPCEPAPMCEPQDARGDGDCLALLGVRWNGERCESMGGCECVGSDCDETYGDVRECERDHAGCAACEAQDAAGSGPCDAELGVRWDGEACRSISGCECTGADCDALYPEPESCEIAHAHCSGGGSCLDDDDCGAGWCRFAPGECAGTGDGLGTCVEATPPGWACGEGEEVCGCDGTTYECEAMASSVGASVLHDGPCPTGGVCAAMDAEGIGSCEPVRGYTWTGSRCEIVSGCECAGADCDSLYPSQAACREAHAGCERAPGGTCGGIAGERCRPDEWCDFPEGSFCGGADELGTCRPRPTGCDAVIDPVCGCFGGSGTMRFDNACQAHAAGYDDQPTEDGSC